MIRDHDAPGSFAPRRRATRGRPVVPDALSTTERWRRRRAATRDHAVPLQGTEKSRRMDLGLALLQSIALPGVCYSEDEIALWAGCTNAAINRILTSALRKVRNYLLFRNPALLEELRTEFFERREPAISRNRADANFKRAITAR